MNMETIINKLGKTPGNLVKIVQGRQRNSRNKMILVGNQGTAGVHPFRPERYLYISIVVCMENHDA